MIDLSLPLVGAVLISGGLYIANKIYFGRKKQKLEALTGVEIQTTWRKHRSAITVGWLKWFALFCLLLLLGENWLHPDIMTFSNFMVVLPPFSIGIPYFGIKGFKRDFVLEEFIDSNELMYWCEDEDYFWFRGTEPMLSKPIVQGDYIPMIQDTIPMIHEKYNLMQLLESAKTGTLTELEQDKVEKIEKRLKDTVGELRIRWGVLMIAIGNQIRPEVVQAEKEESLREMEDLLKKEGEVSMSQLDPALKELYALADNPEAPEDIKLLASNAIRDIEAKIEDEAIIEKEESLRMSAEVTIKTSRQYHGV